MVQVTNKSNHLGEEDVARMSVITVRCPSHFETI